MAGPPPQHTDCSPADLAMGPGAPRCWGHILQVGGHTLQLGGTGLRLECAQHPRQLLAPTEPTSAPTPPPIGRGKSESLQESTSANSKHLC